MNYRILLNEQIKMPEFLKKKWNSVFKTIINNSVKSYIILLGEILEILDNNRQCLYLCKYFEGPDNFGTYRFEWKLKTESFEIYRKYTSQTSDELHKIDVSEDITQINGFIDKLKLQWDGNLFMSGSMEIEFIEISDDKLLAIKNICLNLFKTVEIENVSIQKEKKIAELKFGTFGEFNEDIYIDDWLFIFSSKNSDFQIISIPDMGGMADMIPKNEFQMKWCEKKFSELKGVERIWETVWQIHSIEALNKIKEILQNKNSCFNKL